MTDPGQELYDLVRRAKNMSAWLDAMKLFSRRKHSVRRKAHQDMYLQSLVPVQDDAYQAAYALGEAAFTVERTHLDNPEYEGTLTTLVWSLAGEDTRLHDVLLQVREPENEVLLRVQKSSNAVKTLISYDHILDILLQDHTTVPKRFGTTWLRPQQTWTMYLTLIWMGKHHMLQNLLTTLSKIIQPILQEHVLDSRTVQNILRIHLLTAWETAMHQQTLQDDVPWEWQESVAAQQVYTYLADTEALHHIVNTFFAAEQELAALWQN